jgi:hypothetical protein
MHGRRDGAVSSLPPAPLKSPLKASLKPTLENDSRRRRRSVLRAKPKQRPCEKAASATDTHSRSAAGRRTISGNSASAASPRRRCSSGIMSGASPNGVVRFRFGSTIAERCVFADCKDASVRSVGSCMGFSLAGVTIRLAIGGCLRFFRGARFGRQWVVTMLVIAAEVHLPSCHRRSDLRGHHCHRNYHRDPPCRTAGSDASRSRTRSHGGPRCR